MVPAIARVGLWTVTTLSLGAMGLIARTLPAPPGDPFNARPGYLLADLFARSWTACAPRLFWNDQLLMKPTESRSNSGPVDCAPPEHTTRFTEGIWRRRPDLNRGWRFCRPLPYHLATAPNEEPKRSRGPERTALLVPKRAKRLNHKHAERSGNQGPTERSVLERGEGPPRRIIGAGNGIRTRDFDLGKVALYH